MTATAFRNLHQAVSVLQTGGIVAYPTEAVFGLGCDPLNEQAVRRLLTIKRRPMAKGLIVIAADFDQLQGLLQPLDKASYGKLEKTWPGPVTWLVPVRSHVPVWLRGRHQTLAVRVTAHPMAAALCRAWKGPLVSTSANVSGFPPARTVLGIRKRFGQQVDCIVFGSVGNRRRPSEIRDLRDGRVLRSG